MVEHCRRRHIRQESDLGHLQKNGLVAEVGAPGRQDAIVWWVGLEKA